MDGDGASLAGGMLYVGGLGAKGAVDDAAGPRVQYAWCLDEGFLEVESPTALGAPSAEVVPGNGGASLLHIQFDEAGAPACGQPAMWLPIPSGWGGADACAGIPVCAGLRTAESLDTSVWEVQLSASCVASALDEEARSPGDAPGGHLEQVAGLAGDLRRQGWGVADCFLRGPEADEVRLLLARWWSRGKLQDGEVSLGTKDPRRRSDVACVLDQVLPHSDVSDLATLPPELQLVQRRVNALIAEVVRSVPDIGGAVVCQNPMFAVYPGGGARYTRHFDEGPFQGVTMMALEEGNRERRRVCTLILYLNPFWCEDCGGQLRLYPEGDAAAAGGPAESLLVRPSSEGAVPGQSTSPGPGAASAGLDIAPLHGRLVAFLCNQRNEHEVLPAWQPRLAMSWWLCEPHARFK